MQRILILAMFLALPLFCQRDVRYYFNGKERVPLEIVPDDTLQAWRVLAASRILETVRTYEHRITFFRGLGTNSDALAVIRNRVVSAATGLLFKTLENTHQAQKLRVFRRPGKNISIIEYPEIYVQLKPGVTAAALRQALLEKKYRPGNAQEALHGWAFLDVKVPSETLALADDLNHMPALVVYAEPVLQWVLSSEEAPPIPPDLPAPGGTPLPGSPNDTFFPSQWALYQPFGISMLPVWQAPASPPGKKIRVAVLDAPIDLNHPDLRPVLDVEHQFNATSSKPAEQAKLVYHPDPLKRSDHGTACAGIIAAARGNGFGVAGVASNISIIPIQVLRQDPGLDVINGPTIAQGIRRAVDLHADIITLSANVEVLDDILSIRRAFDDIRDNPSKHVLIVNSTGNDPDGKATGVAFPARYASQYPFLLGVGASDLCGSPKLKPISPSTCDRETTWKGRSDDITGSLLAPGLDIVTTTNVQFADDPANARNYRKNFSGTSAAAPFVTGVAAMLLSVHTDWTAEKVRDKLFNDSEPIAGTRHRRLNACKVLDICTDTPSGTH